MTEIRRWRDWAADGSTEAARNADRLETRAAALLAQFEQVEADEGWAPAGVHERWGRLENRIRRGERRTPGAEVLFLGLACASVAAVALALFWTRPSGGARPNQPVAIAATPASAAPVATEPWMAWPRTDLGSNGALWVEPGSVLRLPEAPAQRSTDPADGYVVRLDRGSLCAEVASRELRSEGPFRVATPHLEVTVIGTHFCVEAGPDLSSVSVQHGRVRVSREEAAVVLEPGESIRSDSPRLAAPLPRERLAQRASERAWRDHPSPGNPVEVPAGVSASSSAGTLETAGSLSVENHLYQQALQETRGEHHAQAAQLFADYLERFPSGLYAPEAGSELAAELASAGRPAEAVAAARERLRAFPRDAHDGEVKLLMAGLLRDGLGRPADALAVYADLLGAAASPDWRAEALFGKGICEHRLGNDTAARETWRRYRSDYPGARHTAEVERLLGE